MLARGNRVSVVVELNRFVSIQSTGCFHIGSCGQSVWNVQVAWVLQVAGELQVLQVAAKFQVFLALALCCGPERAFCFERPDSMCVAWWLRHAE